MCRMTRNYFKLLLSWLTSEPKYLSVFHQHSQSNHFPKHEGRKLWKNAKHFDSWSLYTKDIDYIVSLMILIFQLIIKFRWELWNLDHFRVRLSHHQYSSWPNAVKTDFHSSILTSLSQCITVVCWQVQDLWCCLVFNGLSDSIDSDSNIDCHWVHL